jgi:hypothetical protein
MVQNIVLLEETHMSRTTRFLLLSLFLFGLMASTPDQAFACSCLPPSPPLESMAGSDAVFAGKVVLVEEGSGAIISSADPIKVVFEVSRVWKGEEKADIALTTARDSASCGYDFMVGGEYLVYANNSETGLTTGLCSRTMPLSMAGEDLAALGEGVVPPAAPASASSPLPWVLAISAVVLGLALLVGLILRKPVTQRSQG